MKFVRVKSGWITDTFNCWKKIDGINYFFKSELREQSITPNSLTPDTIEEIQLLFVKVSRAHFDWVLKNFKPKGIQHYNQTIGFYLKETIGKERKYMKTSSNKKKCEVNYKANYSVVHFTCKKKAKRGENAYQALETPFVDPRPFRCRSTLRYLYLLTVKYTG